MALPFSSCIRVRIMICDWLKHSRRILQDGLVIAHVLFLVDKRSLMSRTF